MHKTIKRTSAKHRPAHRTYTKRKPLSDLDKIKAFLWDTSKHVKTNASNSWNHSIDNFKEKSDDLHDYLGERPFISNGVSLVSGLVAGAVLSYYILNNKK